MSKATDFINNKCYQLGNPVEPLIFKADALEAISIASKEIDCLLYTSDAADE